MQHGYLLYEELLEVLFPWTSYNQQRSEATNEKVVGHNDDKKKFFEAFYALLIFFFHF